MTKKLDGFESAETEMGGPLAIWGQWALDVRGSALDAGHFFPEEMPGECAAALEGFFSDP